MIQKIRKQMAEKRAKEMQTPSPIADKAKTPTPKPTSLGGGTSPRIIKTRSAKTADKKMTKGAAKKALKSWMITSFAPTSDYYGETIDDSDISRDTTINTIPKIRKRLVETIAATPKSYVRELLIQVQADVPKEALEILTDEELKKIYLAFEKSRILKIGRAGGEIGSVDEDEWTFRLRTFSDEMEAFIEQGKRCSAGKVFNTITKRCGSPPKEKQQLKKRRV